VQSKKLHTALHTALRPIHTKDYNEKDKVLRIDLNLKEKQIPQHNNNNNETEIRI